MATESEDIIELGSSDDEPEPAPKKARRPPIAMVQIPDINLPKPLKKKVNPCNVNPFANIGIKHISGGAIPRLPMGLTVNGQPANQLNKPRLFRNPIPIQNKLISDVNVKPSKILNNLANNQVQIKKFSPTIRTISQPKVLNHALQIKKIQSNKCLSKLPPGLTVKKTGGPIQHNKVINVANAINPLARLQVKRKTQLNQASNLTIKKFKPAPQVAVGKVLTVELDDDDASEPSTASPQWYIRPEHGEVTNDPTKNKSVEEDPSLDKEENTKEHVETINSTSHVEIEVPAQSLEEQNNAEPEPLQLLEITIEDSPIKPVKDSKKTIEITIEDSPVKPAQSKRAYEIGQELAITIDDSPVKSTNQKSNEDNTQTASGSDDEDAVLDEKDHKHAKHIPHSKKKLEYPKDAVIQGDVENNKAGASKPVEDNETATNLEIEIEQTVTEDLNKPSVAKKFKNDIVIEIDESPLKPTDIPENHAHTPKKQTKRVQLSSKPISIASTSTAFQILTSTETTEQEFQPIYQNFIDLCLKLEDSDDMKKIVEKKIKAYYRQVSKDYIESEEFLEMVSSKIMSMQAAPEKMYLYIKDIVDELNLQRKVTKSQALNEATSKKAPDLVPFYEESELDSKRKRQVRKLEKTLKKLHRAIHKLEEQEVDFDDDGDSVYILTESEDDTDTEKDSKPVERNKDALLKWYKERLVRVHAKLCQLTNTKMPSEPRVHIEPRPGQPAGPARRLEKWINKRVPVGTPLPFPDFHDVLRCVRDANTEDRIGWNEVDIMEEARDLFTRCGKKLQRRRQENEWRIASSRIPAELDPAERSGDLQQKLQENKKVASQKETELINKYADRQKQLKLEAVEIGDKEAEESPVESEDDAQDDGNDGGKALESTKQRKDRLKRLIEEKSKSSSDNERTSKLRKVKETAENNGNGKVDKKTETMNDCPDSISSEKTEAIAIEKIEDISNSTPLIEDVKSVPKDLQEKMEIDNSSEERAEATILGISDEETDKLTEDSNKAIYKIEKSPKKYRPKPNKRKESAGDIHSLSDDSDKVNSDMDELHLLQKLHSGSEIASSTLESSDTDTPIAISDTLGSSSNGKQSSDVVSIENSSYSESETNKGENVFEKPRADNETNICEEVILAQKPVEVNLEPDFETIIDLPKKKVRNSNDEYMEPVENILLASSDDEPEGALGSSENSSNKVENVKDCSSYVNLKDDTISIGDTIVDTNDGSVEPSMKDKSGLLVTFNKEAEEAEAISLNSAETLTEDESVVSLNGNDTSPMATIENEEAATGVTIMDVSVCTASSVDSSEVTGERFEERAKMDLDSNKIIKAISEHDIKSKSHTKDSDQNATNETEKPDSLDKNAVGVISDADAVPHASYPFSVGQLSDSQKSTETLELGKVKQEGLNKVNNEATYAFSTEQLSDSQDTNEGDNLLALRVESNIETQKKQKKQENETESDSVELLSDSQDSTESKEQTINPKDGENSETDQRVSENSNSCMETVTENSTAYDSKNYNERTLETNNDKLETVNQHEDESNKISENYLSNDDINLDKKNNDMLTFSKDMTEMNFERCSKSPGIDELEIELNKICNTE